MYKYKYYTPKVDGGSQIHGWLASRPASLFKERDRRAGRLKGSGRPVLEKLAGRLASQTCIWLHPSMLGVYYWYWYIIGCLFLHFFTIFPKTGPRNPGTCFLFEKKEPLLGRPEESSPSWFLQEIDKSEFSSINLSFYPTHIDATDDTYPMGPPKSNL